MPKLLTAAPRFVTVAGTRASRPPGPSSPFAARWRCRGPHRLDISDPCRLTVIFSLTGSPGGAEFRANGRAVAAGPGYAGLIPPGSRAIWRSPASMEYLGLCFPPAFATTPAPIGAACTADDETLSRIGQVIAAALCDAAPAEPCELPAWSTVLGSHLVRRYGSGGSGNEAGADNRSCIRATIGYIERNLRAALRVADLAEQAGMSRSKFSSEFKRSTGLSPHRFILARRLGKARELLAGDDGTLADIAHDVGFSSQSHMTRAFRDTLGMTPNEYRRRLHGTEQDAFAGITSTR